MWCSGYSAFVFFFCGKDISDKRAVSAKTAAETKKRVPDCGLKSSETGLMIVPEKVCPTELPTIMTAILMVTASAGVVWIILFTQLGINRDRPAPIRAAPR